MRGVKTPEEIKRGLECCINSADLYNGCNLCPYNEENFVCFEQLPVDALSYIQQLEQDNAQKDECIRKICRNLFRAFMQLHQFGCQMCDHNNKNHLVSVCSTCKNHDKWAWRGVEEGFDA